MEIKKYFSVLKRYLVKGFQSIPSLSLYSVPLSTTTPSSHQLIGRVIREQEGKLDPVVVDIHLKGKTATRQASNRMGYYMKQGYSIESDIT